MTPQDISTATPTGGWILGHIPGRDKHGSSSWVPLTMGDSGWMDEDGNPCTATLWVPLPDPQPAPTGWLPPEGTIHVEQITGEGWTCNGKPIEVPYRWMVYILRQDGSYDEYRDTYHCVTYPEAERRAGEWQRKFDLPIEVKFLDPKVVAILPRGTVQ